jgi:tetratricopeptide (TPR) repeat protein
MDAAEREALTARWVEAMRGYVGFLDQQRSQNTEMAATLTGFELPNLFALLEAVQRAGDAEATIDLATSLYDLLQNAGKPRLLERVGQVRDAAAAALGETWSHARFAAQRTRIEQQLAGGHLREALDGARQLLEGVRAAGENAYPGADYDLAGACWLLARVLTTAGGSEQALPLLDEAQKRSEAIDRDQPGRGARIASACFTERGDCLRNLGRLDEAAAAYEEGIRRDERRGAEREVAVGKAQLGSVRLEQRRWAEALEAYEEARQRFTALDEPGTVAASWHQTGRVYQYAGQPEAAEDAYRKSLAITVRLGDVAGQARTLGQLGSLYDGGLDRPEEAAAFYRAAADKHAEIGDTANEGRDRNNVAITLRKLRHLDEARQEIRRAIECDAQFGHESKPFTAWNNLADIETDAGNPTAAAEAKRKAIECFLGYRRNGGENYNADGRICLAVTQPLLADDPAAAASLLQQLAAHRDAAWLRPLIQALQTIVAGSRDHTLPDAPELNYTMAAEILFLLDKLEKAGK